MWFVKRLRENKDLDLSIELLQFAGLWPKRKGVQKTILVRLRDAGILIALVLSTLACTVFHPLGAVMSRNNLVAVFECITVGFLELLTAAKIICFLFREKKLVDLTSNVVMSSRRVRDKYPADGKDRIDANIQKWINAFVVLTTVVALQFMLGTCALIPSLIAKREYFGRIWFPIDPYSSPTYEILFSLWVITFVFGILVNNFVDSLFGATLMQVVGQFRMLSLDLANIRPHAVDIVKRRHEQQDADDFVMLKATAGSDQASLGAKPLKAKALELQLVIAEKKEVEEEMTRILGDCVLRYTEIIGFVQKVESFYTPTISTQIVVSVVAILAAIFFAGIDPVANEILTDIVEIEKRRVEHLNFVLQYTTVVVAIYLELGFGCYLMNLITEESELVREAVYACDWLASTSSFKKSMMIVMSRANQPVFIRAAGFVPMTLETFLKITNIAYSYFTALNAAVHGNNLTK